MIIYKTTNLINGKVYVGLDTKNNPNYLGSGTIITNALKKYGKENFKKEILETCSSIEELKAQEKYWIKKLNTQDKNIGYNIAEGGGNGPMQQETKDKLSAVLKNRIFTKEHRKKISENHADVSGEKNPMYGKKHSDTVKEYSRQINIGKKKSLLTKLKHSKNAIGSMNTNTNLTEKDVLKIRELYFIDNIKQNELAKIYNIGQTGISKIVKYKTWKHI